MMRRTEVVPGSEILSRKLKAKLRDLASRAESEAQERGCPGKRKQASGVEDEKERLSRVARL